jgi:hypothetical protein
MRREKTQINKTKNENGEVTRKSRESLGTTLKTYIQIHWKILKPGSQKGGGRGKGRGEGEKWPKQYLHIRINKFFKL